MAWGRVSTSTLNFNAMTTGPFVEYLYKIGLMCKYDPETDEYEVTTLKIILRSGGVGYGHPITVATIPRHMAHHELYEAKQLIETGLDLHNCFA